MNSIDLVQPRHLYAPSPDLGEGHIYLPTSLYTAGARLLAAGVDVAGVHDENLRPMELRSDALGVNLLGAPYIPEVIGLQGRVRQAAGEHLRFILGGQVVSGLSEAQRQQLFGPGVVNGNDDEALARFFGLNPEALPRPENTSLIPVYERISDEDMRVYLSREFSFYVSEGCKFACDFCAAVRSFREPASGRVIQVREVYRAPEFLERDLDYLIQRAIRLGLEELNIYLSNLDVFQSPGPLLEFAQICQRLKHRYSGFQLHLRGLATVDSFLKARDQKRESVVALVEAGLHTVGFGVDGVTPGVWRAIKKSHNTKNKCIEAIRSARKDFGLSPELLMVFGHVGVDTAETLELAYAFTQDMVCLYGAVPRPHIAKHFVPGNDGWRRPENAASVALLLQHPEAFQSLDFTALPSAFTHPDAEIRAFARDCYLRICGIRGNRTQPIEPIVPGMSPAAMAQVRAKNVGRYDI